MTRYDERPNFVLAEVVDTSLVPCNVGESLVHNNCFEEARKCFHVALKAITTNHKTDNDTRLESLEYDSETTKKSINLSSDIVWHMTQEEKRHLLASACATSSSNTNIYVFSDREDPMNLEMHLLKRTEDLNVTIIKLSKASLSQCNTINRSELVFAILLQNIASTYLCQAFEADASDDIPDLLLNAAYRLYMRSECILTKVLQSQNPHILPEAASIMTVVLRNMIHTASHLGDTEAFQELGHRLHSLLGLVTKLSLTGVYNSNVSDASAA